MWQDTGPRCEQTHAAFEVGLSLDQGQGGYSSSSDVDGSSQVRLCHTCIIDVMESQYGFCKLHSTELTALEFMERIIQIHVWH